MLFYKAECTTQKLIDAENETTELRVKSEIFNSESGQPFTCFYKLGGNKCSLVAAVNFDALEHNSIKGVFERFLSDSGIVAGIENISEITTRTFAKYIELADDTDLVRDQYETFDSLNLEGFTRHMNREIRVTDKIIECGKTKPQIFADAKQSVCGESLCVELERIYDNKQNSFLGHPAHYIISSNDGELTGVMQKILLSALLSRKRIVSRRVAEVASHRRIDGLKNLYSISKGGTVVINMKDDDDDDEYATKPDNIIQICKIIREHKNSVLSVLCCPLSNEKIKARVAEQILDVIFIELREDVIFTNGAKKYLRTLAQSNGVEKCASLLAKVGKKGDNISFRAAELNRIFDTWYDNYLCTEVFAGYKHLKPPSAQNTAPKGDAFSELQTMIGLSSVKKVIKEAIDYHKVQKFLRNGDLEISRHMIFTGNPGTAKTTVARLFSQIMKDNGLLSDGTLVEVGRADLIGKYVGHTAPKVKDAFKRARGGVLFIDEAYSLVDDKRGLYGDEAINTIVQEMENHRDDVIVVFAGYPKEMEDFLLTNPGLRSRIAYHVGFDDYDAGELLEILKLMTSKKKFALDDEASEKISGILKQATKSQNFGNGRYVRNLLERATMKQATRLVGIGLESVSERTKNVLIADDFEPISLGKIRANMGF